MQAFLLQGDIQVQREDGSTIAKFKATTSPSAMLTFVIKKAGDGTVKDPQGYEVTVEATSLEGGVYIFSSAFAQGIHYFERE